MQSSEETGQEVALRAEEITVFERRSVQIVPVWASPPSLQSLVMLGDAPAAAVASLRVIRHRLELQRAEGMWTFGVTSARDREGKSTLAVQLALVLGEARRARVLLVEACFERPSLAHLLGFEVPPGLGFSAQIARRMAGNRQPWAVLGLGPALHVLAESRTEASFPAALHATAFRQALERIGGAYDWVIVDTPSVLGSGDANVVEETVDGMIIAAQSRRSRSSDLQAAIAQLGVRKGVGVVLWDAKRRRGRAQA